MEPVRDEPTRLTFWQRMALRQIRKSARKSAGEPLSEEDWKAVWSLHDTRGYRGMSHLFNALPSDSRCTMCSAPFSGPGKVLLRPLGYRPSRKNPNLCVTCVESSPPGGTTLETGVLFADLRGFTKRTEGAAPREVSALLRRFYRCAEDVLFPEAIIDKLIGDEVMALYLPFLDSWTGEKTIQELMVDHARSLLRAVGYGTGEGPFVEVGVGLDFGEAFVGNIGDRALFDFTAVGDVVNTASRLQGQAAGGEVVFSTSVAAGLEAPAGEPVSLELKGRTGPVDAFRLASSGR